ncbi:hypothetical protein SAMN06297468_1795 [Altererythrobacter xiamenensis]|uniref:Anti-sigma factor NepR domain-containing protein n=1 Tax=Altererythrobacter xiamenensis TaxID=1316679 RepID=A0A1Y6F7Q9_9SPHN|nr:NepR family anti-sigma factor [Altererythrobacter xiamenensis]SMQ69611.1 hypothetical protein SAMN06297468_1795 [Altererythrobacter xiamenensis]
MSAEKKTPKPKLPHGSGGKEETEGPEWADGLRQLYDSVVDEPLPDSFKNLLDQLDQSKGREKGAGQGDNS